ncbi:SAM-dependent methyltransferase [Nonomuraea sp. NPDC049784]|uniref:SAM-dependent methyltransferase n=1 Tax=Nonomuraea sp. NPDC049784 TaxID=3154361 RepID=UPI003409D6AC
MSTGTSEAASTLFTPPTHTQSRVYNALTGGKENYSTEQELAQDLLKIFPGMGEVMKESRRFIIRAAAYLADMGLRQFLDLGCGYPPGDSADDQNVHEVVQDIMPWARVAYVDNDRTVITHALHAYRFQPGLAVVHADVRDLDTVLSHPDLRKVIDPDQEAGVLAGALLHFFDDEAAKRMLEDLARRLAPGSVIALTHATGDGAPEDKAAEARDLYERHVGPLYLRSEEQIRALLKDCRIIAGPHRSYELLPEHPDDVENADKRGPHFWAVIAELSPAPARPAGEGTD